MADNRRIEINDAKNAKRQDRRLAAALRSAPTPQAPDDLLSKLIGQVPEAIPEPRRSGWWRTAWVGALAAAAALIWWAVPSSTPEHLQPQVSANPSHSQPLRVPNPKVRPRIAQVRPRQPTSTQRRVAQLPRIRRRPTPQDMPSEPMKLAVAVGRATPKTIGVATASAWSQDDQGRWTQTQWTLKVDETQSIQAVTLSDENGPIGSVSVTSSPFKNESSETRP